MTDPVDAFLAHHLRFHPVDATFIGVGGHDHRLPPVDAHEEVTGLAALRRQLAAAGEGDDPGARLDRRFIAAELARAQAALDTRPRFDNPAWYTGEAAFAIIALLLPQSEPVDRAALAERLAAIPDFFASGRAHLAQGAAPQGWTRRAQREARAMAAFLAADLRLHPAWQADWEQPAVAAARAFADFAAAIDALPDADPAAGAAYLDLMLRTVHGFPFGADEAQRRAAGTFAALGGELVALAARSDPTRSWQEQVASLAAIGPTADGAGAAYRAWHARAMDDARHLVTPAEEYGLDFPLMAPSFRRVARDLYFLAYRSPPAARPGSGSVYWVPAPPDDAASSPRAQDLATIKSVHAVHHGSIGHHTQNARARVAASRIARLAGTDASMALTLPSAGTMVEGWACYAQELMLECPGFYTPAELLLQKHFERRNAASVLVDIRLHTGAWSLGEARRFYRDEAGFAAERVDGEIVRNTMFPGSRLMYWLGVEEIRALRARWRGDVRAFHDTLLSFGHAPVAWVGDEMERAGMLA